MHRFPDLQVALELDLRVLLTERPGAYRDLKRPLVGKLDVALAAAEIAREVARCCR